MAEHPWLTSIFVAVCVVVAQLVTGRPADTAGIVGGGVGVVLAMRFVLWARPL
jgi:hypothetical protein